MGNYLDTRDLYKRQNELQEELAALEEEAQDKFFHTLGDAEYDSAPDLRQETYQEARSALQDWIGENQEELDELNNLENEVGREWMHGETLIPEDDFADYARDLATDLGEVNTDNRWPFNHIDWEAAADELRQDYSEAEYQGVTYLFRAS